MTAAAGLAGFVDARRPIDLAVTIAADVLFTGNLEVRQGNSILHTPVEVPAGGEKTYMVRLAPPVGSIQTRLRLFAESLDDPAATTTLQLRAPQDETVVAVSGPPELAATIDEAAVALTGSEIVAAVVDASILEAGPYPARYLVLDHGEALPAATKAWLNAGGRVIANVDALAELELDLETPILDGDRSLYKVGAGLVVGVESLTTLEVEDWSQLIEPTRIVIAPRDAWQSSELQLMQAATSAGDQRIPGIPWLFAAVIGYAVLVGPINFMLLRRLGRRELAWVTVPMLSLLAVGGFWLAGRERLQNTLVNHATVILADEAGVEAEARTAVAVAAGNGGEKTVSVPSGWLAYPGSINPEIMGGMPVASAVARTDGNGSFQFSLEQLGAAGVQAWWDPTASRVPDVTVAIGDKELVVDVNNDTDLEYWAWGVVATGRAQVASEALAPGASGHAEVVPGQGMSEFGSLGDAVIQARQLWNDPFIWAKLNLGFTADAMLDGRNTYFFGFTDQFTVPIEIDGNTMEVAGTTLIVIPLDADRRVLRSTTSHLLDTGDASWVDFGPGYLSLSTDEMTVGWNLPTESRGDPSLEVSNMFGEIPRRIDAYNWTTASYDEVVIGETLDLEMYRNPAGDVMVRARAAEEQEGQPDFIEVAMTPYAFTLEWDE